MTTTEVRIQRTKLTGSDRTGAISRRYGAAAFSFETILYALASRYSPDYNGGWWDFYELGNRGFYVSLAYDKLAIRVQNDDNGFADDMSPDAFSVGVNLCALSHLTFSGYQGSLLKVICDDYDRLREYMFAHADVEKLIRFTD